ncbi:MAG: winged helix-turn-helix transcriptional regulator [archaeon]
MLTKRDTLSVLEQTTLPRILVYLLEKEKASRSDLIHEINGSQGAIYNALPMLKESELIAESIAKGFPRRKEIWLTEKGKKVAELLVALTEVLSEDS